MKREIPRQRAGGSIMHPPLSLDDTVHAVARMTNEYDLPLLDATVHAAHVQVQTTPAHMRWWVRWLTDEPADLGRYFVWEPQTHVVLHVNAIREDTQWTVVEQVPTHVVLRVSAIREDIQWTVVEHVPTAIAVNVFARHDVTRSCWPQYVLPATAIALADALGDHAAGDGRPGPGRPTTTTPKEMFR